MFSLRSWSLLPALGRISIFCSYDSDKKRYHEAWNQLQIKVISKNNEVWIPVSYCLRGSFSDEQLQIMRDNVG